MSKIVTEIRKKVKELSLPTFPDNEMGLKNGTILSSVEDMSWCGLATGDHFVIIWDGQYIRSIGLTWSVEGMVQEIKSNYWKIEER